ncbi:MAG: C-GCAxxG-C-C family protein [Bacteroidetes bacterium]|nr:C-GCAxxG-C-C family protein [Bacteroidota bacterium]
MSDINLSKTDATSTISRVEKAKLLKKEGYNCAQSVLLTFSDILDIDENTAIKLTQPLGLGICSLKEVCGVITAMALMLGMYMGSADVKDKDTKNKLFTKVNEIAEQFRKENGSLVCKELRSIDDANPNIKHKPCAEYITDMIILLEKALLK